MWGKRSEWADYLRARSTAQPVGIAIFDHPAQSAPSDLLALRGITACSRRIFSASTISRTTNHATAASPSSPASRCDSASA